MMKWVFTLLLFALLFPTLILASCGGLTPLSCQYADAPLGFCCAATQICGTGCPFQEPEIPCCVTPPPTPNPTRTPTPNPNPAPTPNPTPTTTKSCFSEKGTVVTNAEGTKKFVYELDIGDKVLSVDAHGGIFFDTVFRVAHYDPDMETTFVQLLTNGPQTLELSLDHLLYVNGCCDIGSKFLVPASEVKPGDVVYVATALDGKGAGPIKILKTSTVQRKGVYNVHVLGGTIVVNDIVTTHYIAHENLGVLNRLMTFWHPIQHFFFKSNENHENAVARFEERRK